LLQVVVERVEAFGKHDYGVAASPGHTNYYDDLDLHGI
jgi:hypothetical protein